MSNYRCDTRRVTWKLFGNNNHHRWSWHNHTGRYHKSALHRANRRFNRQEEYLATLYMTDEHTERVRLRCNYNRMWSEWLWKFW
jgi:hypothetical protein